MVAHYFGFRRITHSSTVRVCCERERGRDISSHERGAPSVNSFSRRVYCSVGWVVVAAAKIRVCQHFSIDAGIHTHGQSCPHVDGALTGFLVVYCALVETHWVRLLRCSWFTERIYMRLHILFNTIWIRTGFYLLIYLMVGSGILLCFDNRQPPISHLRERERTTSSKCCTVQLYICSLLRAYKEMTMLTFLGTRYFAFLGMDTVHLKKESQLSIYILGFIFNRFSPSPHRNTHPFSSVVVYGSRFHSMFK